MENNGVLRSQPGRLAGIALATWETGLVYGGAMKRVFSSKSSDSEAGYSVIEIAVVVMIAGIITAASITMFSNGRARYELSRKAQDLCWQIERARSLAVKHNQTLTLGFKQDGTFGLTCTGCDVAKSELAPISFPASINFSARPTLTINGNGTISGSSGITLSDRNGRQVFVSVANSGRVSVGSVNTTQGGH